jgi:hypothetical protein
VEFQPPSLAHAPTLGIYRGPAYSLLPVSSLPSPTFPSDSGLLTLSWIGGAEPIYMCLSSLLVLGRL